jgi:hypothetical protein
MLLSDLCVSESQPGTKCKRSLPSRACVEWHVLSNAIIRFVCEWVTAWNQVKKKSTISSMRTVACFHKCRYQLSQFCISCCPVVLVKVPWTYGTEYSKQYESNYLALMTHSWIKYSSSTAGWTGFYYYVNEKKIFVLAIVNIFLFNSE